MSSVDLLGLNPYCCIFIWPVFSKCVLSLDAIILSNILDKMMINEIGLYEFECVGSLSCFNIKNMFACLKGFGKYPVESVALKSLVM